MNLKQMPLGSYGIEGLIVSLLNEKDFPRVQQAAMSQ
jgi:hypothetical protein